VRKVDVEVAVSLINNYIDTIAQLEKVMKEKLKELLDRTNNRKIEVELDERTKIIIAKSGSIYVKLIMRREESLSVIEDYLISAYYRDDNKILKLAKIFDKIVEKIKQKYLTKQAEVQELLEKVQKVEV
jgi:hypothetical protein